MSTPFLSIHVNHVVPPLRFSTEATDVLYECAVQGIPVMINTFGQLGASSPVTIAGCLAQTNAETLAGMVLSWLINPSIKAIYGSRPMVTDLRTGGMAGGSGEQALLTSGAVQLANFYGFSVNDEIYDTLQRSIKIICLITSFAMWFLVTDLG